jgi:signal transduction histidine kinase
MPGPHGNSEAGDGLLDTGSHPPVQPIPAMQPDRPVPPHHPIRVRSEGGSRLALRNWRLRSKQVVILLVPTITALVLGYLRVSTELDKADEFSRAVTQVDLSAKVSEAIHEIQLERDLVVGRIASGRQGDRGPVAAQIDAADNKIVRLRQAGGSITDLDEAVRELYTKTMARLDTLDTIRRFAEQTLFPASDALAVYGTVISGLLQLDREIVRVSDNRTISQQANTFDAITRAKEQLGIQNSILRAAAIADSFDPGQLTRLRAAQAEFTAAFSDFEQAADANARARYANTVAGPEVDNRLRFQQIAEKRADANAPIKLDLAQLDVATKGTLGKIRAVEIAALSDVRRTAGELITVARNNAIRDAAIVIGALLLALLLMLVVSRSLLKPLRVLRTNALDVANRRLPATVQRILADPDPVAASKTAIDPVPIFTREETGQLARSFDAVHDQAVKMATEQALLRDNINSIFVSLSRRSQALVERLLTVIDRLERDELDPDQLASLFEVDHLATRMRRNSESLLVLSGSGLSKQLSRPVPASEVVGAAVSEVEHYARIEVVSAPEVAVAGRAVNDLVHLIAELLDNATFFSEADKKVTVRMAVTRRRELAIQITDQGVGMSNEEIAIANERLADPPDLDVAVTRRMGLYVVARLAKRHNIVVRLRDNEDIEGGLIARITVPGELVSPAESVSSTAPTRSLSDWGSTDWPSGPTRASSIAGVFSAPMPRANGIVTEQIDQVTGYEPGPPPPLFGEPLPKREVPNRVATVLTGEEEQAKKEEAAEDRPTERLPIFEAVLSQWFSDSVGGDADELEASKDSVASAWVTPADSGWLAARALLDNTPEESVTTAGLPKRVPKARLVPGSAVAATQTEEPTEQDQPSDGAAAPVLPPRSAKAIRSRMASFQDGVRRGRHYLIGAQGSDQTEEQQ